MTSRALLFTDVMDSTRVVEELGDARAAELWAEHDRRARELLARYRGREIDRTDGFFLLFDEVGEAARCALGYHQALAELGLTARAGVHVGAVSLRENAPEDIARGAKPLEVEGLAKSFAARVMALARGGQTLLSAAAQKALGEALPAGSELESHGHYRLKGVEQPVELFELGVRGSSPFAPPADAEKGYRVVRTGDLWRPVHEVRHNLSAERDAFVGRGVELWTLAQRLDAGARLLTVLGSAGSGKTRFVRRYGWTWLGDWPGGIYFCDLSDARSFDGILFAVASALEVPLGKDDPVVQLGHAIAGRGRCLVILDNFEQVVVHAAATLGRWLDRAADAAFVVTSRERLHLPGEELFPLEPLSLDGDAIELFVTRARAQWPGFVPNDGNRAAVAEVVRLLDGLPLAIELAAARVPVLSPAQLLARLKDRFRLLAGARGTAARQATLRAAIDWSWDLLSAWEQAALAQCAVFEGGFTLEAAEAVLELSAWPAAPPVLDAVQALVDKSLLRTWIPAAPGRYAIDEPYFGMYVSIHEYAQEKLSAAGTDAAHAAQERHGRYFARFGTEASIEALSRHGGVKRRRALALELDNLVAACRRAVVRNDAAIAIATYRAAWEVLDLQGPVGLGLVLGAQVFALDGIVPPLRIRAALTQAAAARRIGRMQEAEKWLAQAFDLARELDDRQQQGSVLSNLGTLQRELGRMEDAQRTLESALAIYREAGDRSAQGIVIGSLGSVHFMQCQIEVARACYEQALAIHREEGNHPFEASILESIGLLHGQQGRMEEAKACYEAALALAREVGDRRRQGSVLNNLGMIHMEQGRYQKARIHYEAALAIHRDVGSRGYEGITLGNLGNLRLVEGCMVEAQADFEAALAIHREVGNNRAEGISLGYLGNLHHVQGRMAEARTHYDQSIAIVRKIGDLRFEGSILCNMGDILAREGRISEAREALRAGVALLREVGDQLQLAISLCTRGEVEITAGDFDAARAALAEAETLAAAVGAGPDSELGRNIIELSEALA